MPSTPTAEAILSGDRRALAKAITLVESQRVEDRQSAQQLLTALLPHTGGSIRGRDQRRSLAWANQRSSRPLGLR